MLSVLSGLIFGLRIPEFEFFKIDEDPEEANNLAGNPKFAEKLELYKEKLKQAQRTFHDPWVMKWSYE